MSLHGHVHLHDKAFNREHVEDLLGVTAEAAGLWLRQHDRETWGAVAQRLEERDPHGRTPLHVAAAAGAGRAVKVLVEHGADVFATDSGGETALDIVAKQHAAAQVSPLPAFALGDVPARPPARLAAPRLRLLRAHSATARLPAQGKQREKCEKLLREFIDIAWTHGLRPAGSGESLHPWDRGYKEHNPLHDAAIRDSLAEATRLLGPDPNPDRPPQSPRSGGARSPADTAADGTAKAAAAALIEARDAFGQTPLHICAGNTALKCLELLIARGADVHAKDTNGKTPLDLAQLCSEESKESRQVVSLLHEQMHQTGAKDAALVSAIVATAAISPVDGKYDDTPPPTPPPPAHVAPIFTSENRDYIESLAADADTEVEDRQQVLERLHSNLDGDAAVLDCLEEGADPSLAVQAYNERVSYRLQKVTGDPTPHPPTPKEPAKNSWAEKEKRRKKKDAREDAVLRGHIKHLDHRRQALIWDSAAAKLVETPPELGSIRIIRASNVPKKDSYSDNDMYVRVVLNDKNVGQTAVIQDNNQPEWDEAFELCMYGKLNTLRLELWESDKFRMGERAADQGKDEFIGQMVLEGPGTRAMPKAETTIELKERATQNSRQQGFHSPRGRGMRGNKTLGSLTVVYAPKPPTPRKSRRSKGKSKSSAALAESFTHLRTRRLDFSFCDLTACEDIGKTALRYGIPTWTSRNAQRAKIHLQEALKEHNVIKVIDRPNPHRKSAKPKPAVGGSKPSSIPSLPSVHSPRREPMSTHVGRHGKSGVARSARVGRSARVRSLLFATSLWPRRLSLPLVLRNASACMTLSAG